MRTFIIGIALAALLPVLGGCATAYGSRGLTGGYSDRKIDDSHYVVRFDGNGYASKDRVWYFWIYRCAQLTREKGFIYFTLGKDPYRNSSYRPQARRGHLQSAVLTEPADAGRSGSGQGFHAMDTAGTLIYIPPIRTWHSSAEVSMYKDDFPVRTVLIKAQSVLDQLGAYVRSNGKQEPPSRNTVLEKSAYMAGPDHHPVFLWPLLQRLKFQRGGAPYAPPSGPPAPPPAPSKPLPPPFKAGGSQGT